MSIGLEGQNLIFLISQPRAGSTMSQRILGSHPQIHTLSEPWIMLPALYPLPFENCKVESNVEYNMDLAKIAWQTFFQQLPDQEAVYYQGLRSMYSYIYNSALNTTVKSYFLDKTPRYYYIIPDLYRTFPQSHFIILLRNPLAVLCSIITTWVNSQWSNLDRNRFDITKAPNFLLEGIKKLGNRCVVIHYEKIVIDPENEFRKICQSMGLKFFPEMIEYGTNNLTKWRFGDKKLVDQKTRPDPQNLNKWTLSLKNPQIWQAANDYLELLGHETVYQMGYSYRELRKTLDSNRPQELDSVSISRVEWLQRKPDQHQEAPQTSLGYTAMAKKNEREGKLEEAAIAYRRAIELNPNSAWSYHSLGMVLAKQHKWNEAIAANQQAIKLNPNSASFYYYLAESLVPKGNLEEAIKHYKKASELNPDFPLFQRKLAEIIKLHQEVSERPTSK